jgi:DNA-nicking Smr family endonuclease
MASRRQKPDKTKLVPDFALWARVSKTVDPINQSLAEELHKFENANLPPVTALQAVKQQSSFAHVTKTALQNTASLEFTGIDRRQEKRFLRGKVEIEARLDLHGETLESAKIRLLRFLSDCFDRQIATVLVITGKGSSAFVRHTLHSRDFHESSERSGRLRSALPDWLHDAQFRDLVSGFQPAHPKHGGGGAVYIKLRNPNRRRRY